MFFSKTTNGFYDPSIHGDRFIAIPDPAWTRPMVDGEPDMEAQPPIIEVPNLDCRIPADAVGPITLDEHAALMQGQAQGMRIAVSDTGWPFLCAPPPPTRDEIQAAVENAVQLRLDEFARTRNYDNILSACTYATSAITAFAAEGQYCVAARDAHWAACYGIWREVEQGVREIPTVAAVLDAMPALQWPL